MTAPTLRPCPFCRREPLLRDYPLGGESFAHIECPPCNIKRTLRITGTSEASRQTVIGGISHWWNGGFIKRDRSLPGTVRPPHALLTEAACTLDPDTHAALIADLRATADAHRQAIEAET